MTHIWKDKGDNLTTVYEDDDDILKDGQTLRVKMLARDAATFCKDCSGLGKWKDVGIVCPTCRGSGMLSSSGDPVDQVICNTTNATEGARGGAFGNDHAALTDVQIQMQDRLATYDAWDRATAGSRPGYRLDTSAAGRAAWQKKFDAMAQADDERENAWKQLRSDAGEFTAGKNGEPNVGAGSPARNIGKAKPGQVCKTDSGESGHLDENLVCVADSKRDARTFDQIARDHQAIMQTEYEQYNRQQSEAYRTLK